MPASDARIRGYACDAVADCSADRIVAVRRFPTGENHAVHKLSYLAPTGETRHLVIRVSLGAHEDDREQAEREATVLAKVQGVAAPRLYDFRRESSWFDRPASCTEFIEGESKALALASAEEVRQLGSAVGRLHALPVDDLAAFPRNSNLTDYLQSRLDNIVGRLPLVRDPLPVTVQARLHQTWAAVRKRVSGARAGEGFAPGESLVLLHGDVGAGNVLWNPGPVLIDWEYVRLGDPADEVAYIFSQNELSETQRIAFWVGYHEHPSSRVDPAAITDRVSWWEPTTLLGSSLYWVELFVRRAAADAAGRNDAATPKIRDYYLEHVTHRLDRLDELFASGLAPGQ